MIGYHITPQGIFSSEGDVITEPPYLDWLLDAYPDQPKIFYDIDDSVAGLASLTLDKPEVETLYREEKLRITPYKLTYFPGKFFSIDRGTGESRVFSNFASARLYKEDTHYQPEEGIEEGLDKARQAKATGLEVSGVLESLGLDKNRITSPVAGTMDRYVKKMNIPTVDDIPDEAGFMANKCIKGGWVESWKMGYFDHVYDYDINGAYGYQLSKLLDLRRGNWIRSREIPVQAVYGFCEGDITTRSDFHPYVLKQDNDISTTPVGTWHDFFTLADLKLMQEYNLGQVDIRDGWWWIPEGQQYELFKGIVQYLWQKRIESDGLKKDILRVMLSGIWGRFGQVVKGRLGDYFNPVYASVVENGTRCDVVRTCLEAGMIPLHVAVDGIVMEKPLPVELSKDIGGWKLSNEGKCIIMNSGAVAIEGKTRATEFSVNYDRIYQHFSEHPEATEYPMTKYSPMTIGKALQGRYDKMGEIVQDSRSIYIGRDYKRMWQSVPENAGDLLTNQYDSTPIDAYLAGAEIQ